jgi:hypothetical protein
MKSAVDLREVLLFLDDPQCYKLTQKAAINYSFQKLFVSQLGDGLFGLDNLSSLGGECLNI